MQQQHNAMLVWFSMMASQVLFVAVGLFMPTAESDATMIMTAGGVGLATAAASLAVGRLFAKGLAGFSINLIRWALGEATGIMGLLAWMMGGSRPLGLALMALGLVVVAVQRPTTVAEAAGE